MLSNFQAAVNKYVLLCVHIYLISHKVLQRLAGLFIFLGLSKFCDIRTKDFKIFIDSHFNTDSCFDSSSGCMFRVVVLLKHEPPPQS